MWCTAIINVVLMVIFYFPHFYIYYLGKVVSSHFICIFICHSLIHSLTYSYTAVIFLCYMANDSSVVRTVARHDWILWPRNHKDEIKVSTRLNSLEAWEAKSTLPNSSLFLIESNSCVYNIELLLSLLAVRWRLYSSRDHS